MDIEGFRFDREVGRALRVVEPEKFSEYKGRPDFLLGRTETHLVRRSCGTQFRRPTDPRHAARLRAPAVGDGCHVAGAPRPGIESTSRLADRKPSEAKRQRVLTFDRFADRARQASRRAGVPEARQRSPRRVAVSGGELCVPDTPTLPITQRKARAERHRESARKASRCRAEERMRDERPAGDYSGRFLLVGIPLLQDVGNPSVAFPIAEAEIFFDA